jgi:hypothetical protein
MNVTDPADFNKTGLAFETARVSPRARAFASEPFENGLALRSAMVRNCLIGLLIVFAVINFGYRYHLRNAASDEVQTRCAHEKFDFFYKNQYSDCLARGGPR